MNLVNRATQELDKNFHYTGVGGIVSVTAGIVLSSLVLKIVGISLLALALISYLHQKFLSSSNNSQPVSPVHSQPSSYKPLATPPSQNGKVSSNPPNLSDKVTHITGSITSEEQIYTLASINGIPIDEIERRARPAKSPQGPNQTVENEGVSYSGFLGMNESLKEVLLADWQTVRVLGWTHEALAFHLGAICKGVQAAGSYNNQVELRYDHSGKGGATQTLKATYVRHRGTQVDIFSPSMDFGSSWNGQCSITNISTGASVMWSPGVEIYIRKYGFYEGGGKQNQYRVDPVALISVLTGESEELLRKKLSR